MTELLLKLGSVSFNAAYVTCKLSDTRLSPQDAIDKCCIKADGATSPCMRCAHPRHIEVACVYLRFGAFLSNSC